MTQDTMYYIGTAAWNVPKDFAAAFPLEGTHLQRYSQIFNAVEINTSFYKEHKPATYAKWADSVPPHFRFSVKLARRFTHEEKMQVDRAALTESLSGILALGSKLQVLLVQLPPSLAFTPSTAEGFFGFLRKTFSGAVAFEPRHKSWLSPHGIQLMKQYQLSKVIADPELCPIDPAERMVSGDLVYLRLHGTPEIYKSRYEIERVEGYFRTMKMASAANAWCIFDNTTFGFATKNALEMLEIKKERGT